PSRAPRTRVPGALLLCAPGAAGLPCYRRAFRGVTHAASSPRSCVSASFSAPSPFPDTAFPASLSLPSDALSLSPLSAYGRPAKLIISCTLAHIYFIS
ncbi:hypothetical protein, partial [uncultured Duncaniella sp.]|uniref:hypothetical protein n=1 Tax=uncultured Duncaniella sp. TaxID=2768039 RepID=UPI002674F774